MKNSDHWGEQWDRVVARGTFPEGGGLGPFTEEPSRASPIGFNPLQYEPTGISLWRYGCTSPESGAHSMRSFIALGRREHQYENDSRSDNQDAIELRRIVP
jgi:hypothetical protein